MNRRRISAVAALIALSAIGIAAADSFSDAESAVEKVKSAYQDLKKLDVEETKSLVKAICDAEEEQRKEVGKEASARVKSKVASDYSALEALKDDALKKIKAVLDDPAAKDRHSKAESLQKEVEERWTTIGKMTKALRGANHPVVSWMLETGQTEHRNRQGSSSYCDVAEFTIDAGRVDCLKASGSTCKVIELKPKNSNAITKGRGQAARYAEELNKKGKAFEELKKKKSDFEKCDRFEAQVDCYTLCPDIDSEGNHQTPSVSWSTGC